MQWEKIGKEWACGPWRIRRYGYIFMLLRNGKEMQRCPTIVAAKLAAEAYLNEGV